jgi:hypothetical protein
MADESKFHHVVGLAIADADFRRRLTSEDRSTRASALEEAIGEAPSEDVLNQLDATMKSIDDLATAFGELKVAS